MPNQSGKIVLVLVLLVLTLGAAVYFFLPVFKQQKYSEQIPTPSAIIYKDVNEASKSSETTKNYYSKNLKVSFEVPKEVRLEEKFTDILISSVDGEIQVRRIGTNFKNISEYIENLKEANKLKFLSEESKKVNNSEAILITMEDPKASSEILREYSIYVDNWVFKFSTSDEALYLILDQIVQSFEYKP